ncbi:hypothetical protein [Aeromonas veronii]|uniref:hypothetical protein n=1 Tax=Aeromonas veronii TaxID=654 RepID=UPI001F0B42B4|nr:hypothetical protein [Aeromonas veronii]
MLLMLQEQHPVVGVMTYSLQAADAKGDWIAKVPVFAGQDVPADAVVDGVAEAGRSEMATLAGRVMNHDEILPRPAWRLDRVSGRWLGRCSRCTSAGK